MTALGPAAPKLGKLIRHLATGYDGEIIATVRAIRATLRRHGLDLHDFAAAIQPAPLPAVGHSAEEVIDYCLTGFDGLTFREQDFLHSLARITVRQRHINLSPKQWDWLLSIAAKVGSCDA